MKIFKASSLVIFLFFIWTTSSTTIRANEVQMWPDPNYNSGEPVDGTKAKGIKSAENITIILENGNIYKMTEGDKAQWKFFIGDNQSVAIKEVLVVFKSTSGKKIVSANIKRTNSESIMYGTITSTSASIIENAIAATRDALDN